MLTILLLMGFMNQLQDQLFWIGRVLWQNLESENILNVNFL